jgi:hypothetical protein
MAFHKSNFGSFAGGLQVDVNGFVPEATDGPFDLVFDHGMERTHNDDGSLTEYGEWWTEEQFPDILAAAVAATEVSQARLSEWHTENA